MIKKLILLLVSIFVFNANYAHADLCVQMYGDTENPQNLPVDWPAFAEECVEAPDETWQVMTPSEYAQYRQERQATYDAWVVAHTPDPNIAIVAAIRAEAKKIIDEMRADGLTQRAAAKVMVDEINLLRSWITDFKVQVAAASSLADLKTRVAALPAVPARTLTQFKTAIKAEIETLD